MSDLALLGIKVDASEVDPAVSSLDRLTKAGGNTEAAVGGVGKASTTASRDVRTASQAADDAVRAFGGLKSMLVGLGIAAIAGDIIRTNAEFQSLNASLKSATGSAEAASVAMAGIKKFASETPYALEKSVQAFLKLKNLGLDPSTEAMRSYGNTASSMGKDIMQMVEAVADATTGEFERLKEFGIKAKKEGENVTFVFQGVSTTVRSSGAEIEKFLQGLGNTNFAGAMAEQMNTLNGQWSNLQDNIDALYISIGNLGANSALTTMLNLASQAVVFLTNNLGTIINVIGSVVAGLATYAVATAAATAANALMGSSLGIVGGVVATTTAKFGILAGAQVAYSAATAAATSITKSLTAALMANPFGVAAAALGVLAGAMFYYSNRTAQARAETNNLIGSLKALAQARSADFGLQLAKAQIEQNKLVERRLELEIEIDKNQKTTLGRSVAYERITAKQNKELTDVKQQLLGMTSEINLAKNAYEQAGKAAEKMIVPTAKAAASIASVSGKGAGRAAGKAMGDELAKEAERFLAELNKAMLDGFGQITVNMAEALKGSTDSDWSQIFADARKETEAWLEPQSKMLENQATFNDELERLKDIAGSIDLGSVFGRGGDAIDGMANAMARLAKAQKVYGDAQYAAEKLTGVEKTKAKTEAEKTYSSAKINGAVAYLGAAKSLFREESAGAKAMEAAQKALMAVQLVKTGIDVAGGAAKMFASLGPFAFPAVAAMLAVMASVGFKGGGSASGYKPVSSEDMQSSIGTGTVAGDSTAQSDSLANSLKIISDNTNKDLQFSNQQVNYLRDIANNIGTLVKQIGNEIGLKGSGMFSTTSLGLGQTGSSGFLGILGGGSTTRTLYDQGIQIAYQTIGDVVASGVKAQVYNVIEQVKKSNGFLGIGGSTKTTYSTVTGEVNASIENQMKLIVGNLGQTIVGFAQQLGIKAEQDVVGLINSKVLAPLQLSFKDMNADEIEAALQAYFSSVADDLSSVLGGFLGNSDGSTLADLQRAGEGLFETLTRVVSTISTVDTALKSINMPTVTALYQNSAHVQSYGTSGALAGSAINLADQFGGLDALQSAVASFADKFLTEAERMQPIITAVRDEMARLGASGVTTNEQFKQLVQGLDLSSESGQQMFASLLSVAPAFDKVTDYLGSLNGALGETGKTAAQLAEIAKQRRSLEIDLMQAMGDTAGAIAAQRADQLASLDESNRALQQQVWATLDATAAEKALADVRIAQTAAAEALAKQKRGLEIDLMQAIGDTAGAVAAKRADELAALDETLRSLQMQVWAAQDAAQAANDLAAAQADAASAAQAAAEEAAAQAEEILQRAKVVSDERRRLEIELMDAIGNATGALAARRSDELATLDESNRAIQEQIYTALDAAAAATALAQAQTAAADAAARAQAEAADAAARAQVEAEQFAAKVQSEAISLQIRLYQALGNAAAATALQREQELASTDASNRATLESIYAAEDATAAQKALADAQAAATQIAEAAAAATAQAAKEAAAAMLALAQKRRSLEIELMEATGDAVGALAAKRQDELAALDPTLHTLQQMVWAAQDAAGAVTEVGNALDLLKARADLEIRLMEAQGNASGALAARRAQELAATDASLQGLLQQVYAAEDAAKAAQAQAEAQAAAAAAQAEAMRAAEAAAQAAAQAAKALAEKRSNLEIDLLNATGQTVEAVARQRQMELAALDGSLQGLQNQVWAAQDAAAAQKAATDALNATIEAERALAEQRSDLTLRLLEAEGNATAALAMKRELELAATDASLRVMLQAIYAAEDAATAQDALAQAQETAAEIAEDAAAKARETAEQRASLEIDLLNATGQAAEAVAVQRALELAALDTSLQALQAQVWAAQDATKAAEELAAAQADQAAAAAELAKATQDMTLRLLDAQGQTAAATLLRRQIEMAATDESLRGMLAQIYAAEDAAAAIDAYNTALGAQQDLINTARDNLSAAYQREAGALGDTIDKFTAFSASLREFRATLTMGAADGANSYRQAQMEWLKTSALAAAGDAGGLGGLAGASQAFLEASRNNASSLTQYQRDVAMVARSVDAAVAASDQTVDYAQAQLDELKQSVAGLIELDESVLSVRDAIIALQEALLGETPTTVGTTDGSGSGDTQTQAVVTQTTADLRAEIAGLRADLNAALLAIKTDTGKQARILERVTADDSLRVSNESDTPLYTEVTA